MARIESLSAVTLTVADMARSTAFYDALGLEAVHDPAEGFTSYRCGPGYINLQHRDTVGVGDWGRAIVYCDDVDAMWDRVVAAGGQPDARPSDAPWDERYFHCRDPDGHELSFARPIDAPVFRAAQSEDIDDLLAMNQAEVPAVGSLDRASFTHLLELADAAIVAWRGGQIAGFVVLIREGSAYGSPNYRWFAGQVKSFLYVDRLVVAPDHRRRGVARALYQEVFRRAGRLPVLAEVNLRPRNEESLAFHDRLGFVEMGQLSHGSDKEVTMLRRRPGDLVLSRGTLTPTTAPRTGEHFDALLHAQGVVIEQITSSAEPDTSMQSQAHGEWVLLLEGRAIVEAEGVDHVLGAGQWLTIPAGTAHRVRSTSAGTRWLAVHLPPEDMGGMRSRELP